MEKITPKVQDVGTAEYIMGFKNLSPQMRAFLSAMKQIGVTAVAGVIISLMQSVLAGQKLDAALLQAGGIALLSALLEGIRKYVKASSEPDVVTLANNAIDAVEHHFLSKYNTLNKPIVFNEEYETK